MLNRLRTLVANEQDKAAAKALLVQALRHNCADSLNMALRCLVNDMGKPFEETIAAEVRWGRMLKPLWDGRTVLACIGERDYSGHMDVLSFDNRTGNFLLHGWSWGSCSSCDGWEAALYEFNDPYEEDDRPVFTEEDCRQEIKNSSTSYTPAELFGVARMGKSRVHEAIRYLLDSAPIPEQDRDEWGPDIVVYAKPEDFGLSPALTAEEHQIQVHNEENRTGFTLGDLVSAGRGWSQRLPLKEVP